MDYPFVAGSFSVLPRTRAALAVSRFVCYNAGRCQLNKNQPDRSDPATPGEIFMASCRAAICLAAIGLSALLWSTGGASALDYPTRPVRFVVGYPAGGATDILARIIGQRLSE